MLIIDLFFLPRYQVWLEAYLRNGKVMQSNVLEITTEDGAFDPNSGRTYIILSSYLSSMY